MTRIVIADDHTMVREGLKQVLSAAPDLTLIGEARDGTEVMQLVRELDFDVLVLDLSMPGRSGTELIRQVHAEKPKLRILVLSMHEEKRICRSRRLRISHQGQRLDGPSLHLKCRTVIPSWSSHFCSHFDGRVMRP